MECVPITSTTVFYTATRMMVILGAFMIYVHLLCDRQSGHCSFL